MRPIKPEISPLKLSEIKNKNYSLLEIFMINVFLTVKFAFCVAFYKVFSFVSYICKIIIQKLAPFYMEVLKKFVFSLGKIARKISDFAKFNLRFISRIREYNISTAVKLQFNDITRTFKNSKEMFKTSVNYLVPVASIALLISIVNVTVNTDYGISVVYNGKDMGIVSAEAVINDVTQNITDVSGNVTVFSDSGEVIGSNLQIIPLNGYNTVIDEKTLTENLEKELVVMNLSSENGVRSISAESFSEEFAGKTKAFAVSIDGEVLGGVEDTKTIAQYLRNIKAQYTGGDVIDASFDKNIEYTYEQYFAEDEMITEREVIEKLKSVVAEPVYYEVELGDNPWIVARRFDMSLDELYACVTTYDGEVIPDITKRFPVGALIQLSEEVPYLQILVTKNEVYAEKTSYKIVETTDSDLYKGQIEVDIDGKKGETLVTAHVTYKNGIAIKREVVNESVLTEPVTQYQRVGTRSTKTEVKESGGGSGDFFWPVEGGYISDPYISNRGHKGIDIAAPYGTKIYAAETGKITKKESGWGGGYGNNMMLEHDDGYVTVYAHMSSFADLDVGDTVVKGQLIGFIGSTGQSSGNHLHFEVREYGSYRNPSDYVNQN